jgi:hypothetical protein
MAGGAAVAGLGATTSGRLEVTLCGMDFLRRRNSPSLDLWKAKLVHLHPILTVGEPALDSKIDLETR